MVVKFDVFCFSNMLIPCAWSSYDGCQVLGQLKQAECPSEESESKVPESALETPAQPKKYYDYKITTSNINENWIPPPRFTRKSVSFMEMMGFGRRLKFKFPFYGHYVHRVRMLPSGILSLSYFKAGS